MKPIHLLMALSVAMIFGLGFTFSKAALGEFPPIFLMALRFSLTALVLVWLFRPPVGFLLRICAIAFISATLQYSLTFTGLKDVYASTAILIVQLEVPFAALLAAIFLADPLGWRRAMGMALAFVGIGLIVGEPRLQNAYVPVLLIIGGAFTWSVGQVMIKTLAGRVPAFLLVTWVAVFAGPQLFVVSFLFEEGQMAAALNAGWTSWATVLYLGLVMNALGYACWYHLLGLYPVNNVMPFMLVVPVTTVVGGVLILGEELSLHVIGGGPIVIFGVAIIVFRRPRQASLGPEAPSRP